MMAWQRQSLVSFVAVLVSVAFIAPALADPPPWAPAWGWRAKHHYDGDVYVVPSRPTYAPPYGIAKGTCYRTAIGALIGAGAGAYAGSHVGKGSGRIGAIVGGGVLGALAGGLIGHWMDQLDQGCVEQVLEHAETGKVVQWTNPDNGVRYAVTPVRTYQAQGGHYCRDYTTTAIVAGQTQEVGGTACRQPDGSWQLAN